VKLLVYFEKQHTMKKIVIQFVIIILIIDVSAQSPQKMSYQCVVRNANGALVANQEVGMKISILQDAVSGSPVYVEIQTTTTNSNGLATIEIGGGMAESGDFGAIDWADGPYFLKTETDPAGATNYTITGTSQLLSVPYAYYAETAGNGFSGDYSDLANKPTLFSGSFFDLLDKPTTISGYGITDAMNTSHPANAISAINIARWDTAYVWGNHTGLYRPLSYVPAWNEITSKPTTIAGFGITDAVTTSGNQNIGSNKKFTGTITVPVPVNAEDAATKAYVDVLKAQISDLEDIVISTGQYFMLDVEGNKYTCFKIGTQIWMAENLKYLPSVVGPATGSQTTPYYYVYGYNGTVVTDAKATANYTSYGVLYNWPAAMNGAASSTANPSGVQGVCPTGWHLPSYAEWTQLSDYLGGINLGGCKLKETGTSHWLSPNTGATNETGFTALPGGDRHNSGAFGGVGYIGFWWSATEVYTDGAWYWLMDYNSSMVGRGYNDKELGHSVRCVRD